MKRLLSIVLFIGASLWAHPIWAQTSTFAVGVRVYYTFQLLTERSHRIRTGDTRGHHNRYYYY